MVRTTVAAGGAAARLAAAADLNANGLLFPDGFANADLAFHLLGNDIAHLAGALTLLTVDTANIDHDFLFAALNLADRLHALADFRLANGDANGPFALNRNALHDAASPIHHLGD